MLRVRKTALTVLAGLLLVAVSACSSSAATPAAGGNANPGATQTASGPTASAAVTANPNDPNSIITQAIGSGVAVTSFHIKLTVSGTVNASALSSAAGSAGTISGNLKLDGTSVEGDVDVADQAAHLALSVPALPMLGNAPLSGDLILVGNNMYYKVSLLGPKYTMLSLGSLTSGLGALASSLPIPSAAAVATTSLTDEVAQLRAAMVQAGVTATLVGVEQIGGQSADHISFSVPLNMLNAEMAAAASPSPAPTIDSASVDLWVYTSNYQIAQLEIKAASSTLGNLDLAVTVSNYDKPVTIAAPPASEVQTTP